MSRYFKVLIVEDDPTTLSILCKMVRAIGDYEVVSCQSAKEAIRKMTKQMHKWKPDVILSDFMMDNGDGIDLLNSVRKEFGENIPFVFITCANKYLITPLLENSVNTNIISKPLRFDILKNIFNNLSPTSSKSLLPANRVTP